jgi:hypothetical protein
MKTFKTLMSALLFAPLLAQASTSMAEMDCRRTLNPKTSEDTFQEIHVTGRLIGDWIKNAKVVVRYKDYNDQWIEVTGRAAQLVKDENYNPRKYVGYQRFDLSRLTETEKFGSFTPEGCSIYMMIPENASELQNYTAALTIQCDQSGGKATLRCVNKIDAD